jgi:hypothetical protein
MKVRSFLSVIFVSAFFSFNTLGTVHYVDLNCTNPVSPYTSWATAATNIQDAVNHAVLGDTVLVTNGIYQYGGDSFNGSNRVDAVFGATVQSVNGPAVTMIKGYQVPGTTNGAGAVRCVYLREFSTLSGFTLTNGATSSFPNGGGVVSESSCTITNCVITGNAAGAQGGGSYTANGSLLVNCIITGNLAGGPPTGGVGGGTYGNILNNCIVTSNSAGEGGGMAFGIANNCLLAGNGNTNNANGTSGGAAYLAALNNCTLVGNFSRGLGAADGCTLNNSIIFYNVNGFYSDCYMCRLTNCCTTLGLGNSSLPNNSISNAPVFVDMAHGNCRLQIGSPGIDAGTNIYAPPGTDLDGNPRIVGGTVDMGAYENQNTNPVHYVSLSSTNPVTPYTNWSTAATNIQDAVGAAQPGEFVVVSNGIYRFGGAAVYGQETNRVALTNAITLLGLCGPQATVIVGSILGSQTRCVYVGSNAVLNGFTLVNGLTRSSGDSIKEQSGGGAWCETSGVISNCVFGGTNFPYANGGSPSDGCSAQWEGGAVYGGTIYNSTLANNSVIVNGGAAAAATLVNCIITTNTSANGYVAGIYQGIATNCTFSGNVNYESVFPRAGGAYQSTLYHCTLTGNQGYTGAASSCTNYNCTLANNSGTYGGGTYGGVLYNCLVSNNTATVNGGGAYQSTLYNCTIVSNTASMNGGGVCIGVINNCLISNNHANSGAGAYQNTLNNCILKNNIASGAGGGTYQGTLANCTLIGNASNLGGGAYLATLNNCIIYYNVVGAGSNYFNGTLNYCCTTPLPAGSGNITNEPAFVDLANSDFHLQPNSPCINSGNNTYVVTNIDFDGNPRIQGGTVDIGAYEYQTPVSKISYAWLQQYSLPITTNIDTADLDGTGLNVYQDWIAGLNPTNALSVLAMLPPAPTNNPAGLVVSWQSVSNITYFLQSSTNLGMQPAFSTIQSNILGQTGTTSYTDTNAIGNGPFFYRVGVQQ